MKKMSWRTKFPMKFQKFNENEKAMIVAFDDLIRKHEKLNPSLETNFFNHFLTLDLSNDDEDLDKCITRENFIIYLQLTERLAFSKRHGEEFKKLDKNSQEKILLWDERICEDIRLFPWFHGNLAYCKNKTSWDHSDLISYMQITGYYDY